MVAWMQWMMIQRNMNLVSTSTALSEMVLPLGQISGDWQEAVTAWLILFILKQSMGRNGQLGLPLSLSLLWLLVDCHFHSSPAVKMGEILLTHVTRLSGAESRKILIAQSPI